MKKMTEMRSKVWNIDTKSVVFKTGWGAWKNDRNEINSVDDQYVCLCIRVTFSSIGKVLKLPDG